MIPTILILASLTTSPEAKGTEDLLATYEAERAQAGRDADAQVRLALWCESRGLDSERLRHLAIAILTDPRHATARGLLGMIHENGSWKRPEEVSRKLLEDAARIEALSEYHARREKMKSTADAHWRLALWCAEHGLESEATAHFTAVTRLAPKREAAWKRLGFIRHHGRWMSPDQIASLEAEAQAQASANERWFQVLKQARRDLARGGEHREEAETTLTRIKDPRAVPMVWKVLVLGSPFDQGQAVQVLGQIDSSAASRALAALALAGQTPYVRRAATETLRWRDPTDYLDMVFPRLQNPIQFAYQPVGGPGMPGTLLVSDGSVMLRRFYTPPSRRIPDVRRSDELGLDANGLPMAWRSTGVTWGCVTKRLFIPFGQMMTDIELAALSSKFQLEADVAGLRQHNAAVRVANDQLRTLLSAATGVDLGDDRESWQSWYRNRRGQSDHPEPEPEAVVVDQQILPEYRPTAAPRVVDVPVLLLMATNDPSKIPHRDPLNYEVHNPIPHNPTHCFAAGTPVRTLTGSRPIESIRVGDNLLVQDGKTGALSYQPVVAVSHNPPAPTVRLDLRRGGSIVATPIHRVWKAGQGWTMFRDLESGQAVRSLGGADEVVSLHPAPVQPVFNLEVARGGSFFVGEGAVLVHDNSPNVPIAEPFDAIEAPASVADTRP